MPSDIDTIRQSVSLSAVAAQYGVKLRKDGGEFIGCCPFHNERSASFTVFVGRDKIERFHCFGCTEKGDVLDFVQKIKGVGVKEAIAILGGGRVPPENIRPREMQPVDIYAGIVPVATDEILLPGQRVTLYNPKRAGTEREWGAFAPSLVHPYYLADETLLGYVLRHDMRGGDKETPMVQWARLADGKECWCRLPFPKPRPLYGLLAVEAHKQIIVVEGEKCADALFAATGRPVVSWAGGSEGAKHTDWSPLARRNVIVWPDADKPGLKTAYAVATILDGLECTVRTLDLGAVS